MAAELGSIATRTGRARQLVDLPRSGRTTSLFTPLCIEKKIPQNHRS